MTKITKADQVRAFLKGEAKMSSFQIAAIVGCHASFVRATKQRMLHPERERERNRIFNNAYYRRSAERRAKIREATRRLRARKREEAFAT